MASVTRRQIIGGGAQINKSLQRRPQIVGGGAALPAHGSRPSIINVYTAETSFLYTDRGRTHGIRNTFTHAQMNHDFFEYIEWTSYRRGGRL